MVGIAVSAPKGTPAAEQVVNTVQVVGPVGQAAGVPIPAGTDRSVAFEQVSAAEQEVNKVMVVEIAAPAPRGRFVAGKAALARERVGRAVADMPMGVGHSPVEVSVENKVGTAVTAAPAERGQWARALLHPSRN